MQHNLKTVNTHVVNIQADVPPTPPSQSAKRDNEEGVLTFKETMQSIKQLFTIPFAASSISVAIMLGKSHFLSTVLSSIKYGGVA